MGILLVGAGRMGGALLSGWLEQGERGIVVVEPRDEARAALTSAHAGLVETGALVPVAGPDALADPAALPRTLPRDWCPISVIFAVKPQDAAAVVPAYARWAANGAAFVSIMAGVTTARLRAALDGAEQPVIVRAMPNTPAAIRQGFTVAYAAPGLSEGVRGAVDRLLSAAGEVAWVAEEALLDPVTAISGGGPAYVFLLAELLEAAGVKLGLPAELARRMARRTVAGSGALLGASAEDAAALRRAVTSPKGTTERALAVLMAEDAWPALVDRAMLAATGRSRELAG